MTIRKFYDYAIDNQKNEKKTEIHIKKASKLTKPQLVKVKIQNLSNYGINRKKTRKI